MRRPGGEAGQFSKFAGIAGTDAAFYLTYTRGHVVLQQTMQRSPPSVASMEEVHGQRPDERLSLVDRGQGRGPIDQLTVESETTLFSFGYESHLGVASCRDPLVDYHLPLHLVVDRDEVCCSGFLQ